MQLTITTDYAIRGVLYLAQRGCMADARAISDAMQISRTYVIATMSRLRAAGIVSSRTGVHGGYWLAKPPENINLYEIVSCIEGTMQINQCMESDHICSRHATKTCPVRKFYTKLQQDLDTAFQTTTIAQLLQDA